MYLGILTNLPILFKLELPSTFKRDITGFNGIEDIKSIANHVDN